MSAPASTSLDVARAVADSVLYEGYLLYPYRASAAKNQSRWQFGVLGPPGAAAGGVGEQPTMSLQTLLRFREDDGVAGVIVRLRFLQLQHRAVERLRPEGGHEPVTELHVADRAELTWDEAVEHEHELWFSDADLAAGSERVVEVDGGEDAQPVTDAEGRAEGRVVRRRWPLLARVTAATSAESDGWERLELAVENTCPAAEAPGQVESRTDAVRRSLLGAHLLVEAREAEFVSVVDPPAEAAEAAGRCRQERCWPFLAGHPGERRLLLGSPIILEDHARVAPESSTSLFDATEIDEILTLRVLTMTDAEKAEARATDPRAAAIIDRCDELTAEDLQRMHGTFRDPAHAGSPSTAVADGAQGPLDDVPVLTEPDTDVPWWDPARDAAVAPDTDSVLVDGVPVANGSLVRLRPRRRADAHDMFFDGQQARVTAVLGDVDGGHHIAVVLVDDPAAELHDWYGRYLYFAPEEIEPLPQRVGPREEDHS